MEEANRSESWNKKRIFIALCIVILLLAGGYIIKSRILGAESDPEFAQVKKSVGEVKGADIKNVNGDEEKESPNINVQEAVKERIKTLKQEVLGLNIVEIASSSPQIQKIINDIKSLEQYPVNQAKEICKKICGL